MASSTEKEARVIGFLVAKGLLIDPQAKPLPQAKLDIQEVLDVAEDVEPRVYEVLPAAVLHFPRSFRNLNRLPPELFDIIKAIRRREERASSYRGIKYRDMKRWADLPLADKRTKPLKEKRVMKAFRFKRNSLQNLARIAKQSNITETEVIESLLETAAKKAK